MLTITDRPPEKDAKSKLLEWAKRHPAATALGVIVFAALCFLPSSTRRSPADQPSADLASDDAPLFI